MSWINEELTNISAARCAVFMLEHHSIKLDAKGFSTNDKDNVYQSTLHEMSRLGLTCKVLNKCDISNIIALGSAFPVIAIHKNRRWVIVTGASSLIEDKILINVLSPGTNDEVITDISLTCEEFNEIWNGTIILCKRKEGIFKNHEAFGFSWFIPEIKRNAKYYKDIALLTILINQISLVTPLLFQVIIDRVVAFKSYQTLYSIVAIYIFFVICDGLFNYVRQCLMVYATNKIDASLNSRTFEHMLSLPLYFFETISAGILIRNMHQTDKIRGFLTGQLFHVALEVSTLPILLTVLMLYSAKLTMIVLCFAATLAIIIAILLPTYRNLLEKQFKEDGLRQSTLVETIHGARTVKSLALEPARNEAWNNGVINTIRQSGLVGIMTAKCSVLFSFLDKVQMITIISIGITDVFDGTLSMGSLIAFNMMSGRVTGPLVQLVSLINSYQDTVVSLKYLGVVMDHKPEREGRQGNVRPVVNGKLEFNNVTFLYPGAVTPAVNRVSFKIEEGQVVGIVGRSGSGKTTITRLIQGIYAPQEGVIRLNNVDLRHMDLLHLRTNIGVVLQDNFLFRGTIRDNLAIAKPNATIKEIIDVVRLAGAEEFIDRLPNLYNSFVEEGGTNFSGGQRQRLAIARALLLQPRLLIFDEATSALDPDSEAVIQNNLDDIARGRTLIIVSHRLSSLVKSDKILVLEKGKVADMAPHSTLVQRCDVYRHLWHQQTKHVY